MTTFLLTRLPAEVCPVAPPGAAGPTNQILGYVMWGVILLFGVGVMVGVGAMVAGRVFGMPHASKAGMISLVVVLLCIVAYLVLPSIVSSMLGTGCMNLPGTGGTPAPKKS